LGLSEDEAAILGDFNVQQNIHRFSDFTLEGEQADAMVMDIDHQNFKYVWFQKPKALDEQVTLQYRAGDLIELEGDKKLAFAIDSYQHNTQKL